MFSDERNSNEINMIIGRFVNVYLVCEFELIGNALDVADEPEPLSFPLLNDSLSN